MAVEANELDKSSSQEFLINLRYLLSNLVSSKTQGVERHLDAALIRIWHRLSVSVVSGAVPLVRRSSLLTWVTFRSGFWV